MLEAILIGLFFIQGLRFLIGQLYARLASAITYPALDPALIDPSLPGLVDPETVTTELSVLAYMMALPLLALLLGRFRPLLFVAAVLTAVGRYFMLGTEISPLVASAMTVGGGLLYIALVVRHRARVLPTMLIMAFALDQLYRAFGDTLDPSWSLDYATTQLVLTILVIALALITVAIEVRTRRASDETENQGNQGLMPFWSGLGFGALLYLELALLALPNAAAGRAETDYTLLVPMFMVATLLPLVPWVRGRVRGFIALFDSNVRGWVWMLVIALLVVFGTRLGGIVAGAALVLAQFCASMMWWWFVRPRGQQERSFGGLWLFLGVFVFALLVTFDVFTYEYAFVRDFSPELDFLNPIIPPLLRGFRGLGLAVLLLSVFFAVLPMTQAQRRIAWSDGPLSGSVVGLLVVGLFGVLSALAAQPPVIQGVFQPETMRVGTYNIHAGYNEFYNYDLEDIALTIQRSGADVVLLQEVEAGRLTSFGVDQTLWLGRRLGMDRRFFATNEGLHGLAVLSRVEIVFDDGVLLDSIATQTGLQRVQVLPDSGVITVYNTWLDPLLDTGGELTTETLESSQQAQLSQIIAIINAHHAPDRQLGRTVIGGTFNNIPESQLIRRMIESGFEDHFAGQPLELSATFWRTGQRARLDYLWLTRNLPALGAIVIDTHASDHRMAVIEVELRTAS
jgi:endonuclease/exonuclease/phosphatase family metal-dependent hydrolase